MLRARWRLVAAFVLGGVALMAIVTLLMDREYTAMAVVHVENDVPHVTKIDQVVSGSSYLESVDYFQDQANLLKSRTLIASVARELDLEHNDKFWSRPPGFVSRIVGSLMGLVARLGAPAAPSAPAASSEAPAAGIPSAVIDRYLSNLEVKPIPNSR